MFEKLLNKLPFWRRLDETFLLRYPRLWQTRIHVAALFALMAYPLVFLFGAVVVRLLIVFAIGSLTSGTVDGTQSGIEMLDSQILVSYLLNHAAKSGHDAGQTILFLAGLLSLIIVFAFWLVVLRGQSRYSIEQVYGKRSRKSIWIEWLSYIVSVSIFVGVPILLMLSASPFLFQSQKASKFQEQMNANVEEFGNIHSVRVDSHRLPDGSYDIGNIIFDGRPSGVSASNPFNVWQIKILAPAAFTATFQLTSYSTPASPSYASNNQVHWKLETTDPGTLEYLSDLREYTYANIFSQNLFSSLNTGAAKLGIALYQSVIFWWLVGFVTLIIFMSKRGLGGMTLAVIAFCIFVLPTITSTFSSFLVLGIGILIAATSPSSSAPFNLSNALIATTTVPYLIILTLCLTGTILAAYHAKFYRRRFSFAIALFPFWFGLLPIQILIISLIVIAEGAAGVFGPSPLSSTDSANTTLNLVLLALAIMPFFYALFLPLIDRAATRLMSLPKEK